MNSKIWLVTTGSKHVICTAASREYAKSKAHSHLGGNPDYYTVTPLTEEGDRVAFDITIT